METQNVSLYFMFKPNILAINLPEREDRRELVTQEVEKFNYNSFQIVPAIRDSTCFKSHRRCIEIAKERGFKEVLIVEDDFVMVDGFEEVLNKAIEDLRKEEWSILFLGANLQGPAQKVTENLYRLSHSYALHCYFVNETIYDEILAIPAGEEMDVQMNRIIIPNFSCFVVAPLLSYQRVSFSDLQGRVRDYTAELDYNFKQYTNA